MAFVCSQRLSYVSIAMRSSGIVSLGLRTYCVQSESKLCYDRQSVGQSVLVSSPIWGPRSDFYYRQTAAGLLMLDALSDEMTDLTLSPAQPFWGPSPAGLMTIVSHSSFPQPGGPGPRIYNPQALGSFSVATFYSQCYGGGIPTRLHSGIMFSHHSSVNNYNMFRPLLAIVR
jgi:hypothetical protein